MKAIVLSHENGGSYCIDSTGSFHFVKGYENVDIGTEIIVHVKKPMRFRKLWVACAAAVIVAAVVGFMCAKNANSQYAQVLGDTGGESVYAGFCVHDSTIYCQADIGCRVSCPRN